MQKYYWILGIIIFSIITIIYITQFISTPTEDICKNECSSINSRQCVNNGYMVCGNYNKRPCLEWSSVTNCPEAMVCNNGVCTLTEVRTAQILDIPLPENLECLFLKNANLTECQKFYKGECLESGECYKDRACEPFYNPVYDINGIFYPSACWAEQLGVNNYQHGYSNKMLQFFNDLWYTPKHDGYSPYTSYNVPKPNIEFTYSGDNNGVYFRSTLWNNSTSMSALDFNIVGYIIEGSVLEQYLYSPSYLKVRNSITPVYGYKAKILLVFIIYDNAYPEEILVNWTKEYEKLMNDYLSKKQQVPNTIQYGITPVIIAPPEDVKFSKDGDISDEEIRKIYDIATNKIKEKNFDILVLSPVSLEASGGYYSNWKNMGLIFAPLGPNKPYSVTDKIQGLNSLASFQHMFVTISHEILHAVGLPGDHVPMGYGTTYLDAVGQNVDPITGKIRVGSSWCDFLGISPDYYAVELPYELMVRVGEERSEWYKEESSSGSCLWILEQNTALKDYDNDGKYEIMYNNNLIGKELQRALGWVDIDGDGITEIVDPNPYGGYKTYGELASNFDEIGVGDSLDLYSFEPLEEVSIDDCKFGRIKLENGEIGLVPLKCKEFNQYIVNLYKKVKYKWLKITKEYGTVFIAFI